MKISIPVLFKVQKDITRTVLLLNISYRNFSWNLKW